MASFRDEVDNLLNLAFGRLGSPPADPERGSQFLEGWFPAVDVYEDKDNLLVRAELPGMKKEDIEISLHEGFLTLSGERKSPEKQEGTETFRSERWLGRFQRTISLPCSVVPDKIKATYTDGILSVSLPKAEEAKPKQIPISVN
jgi:HSP20 family protein